MTNLNTNNTELNKAIYTVITTQYKKDCREAHKAVEDAGFKIRKIRGGYEVVNTKTNRDLYTSRSNRWGGGLFLHYNWYKRKIKLTENFDFVNCLNTPYNEINEQDNPWIRAPKTAKEKHDRIKSMKWDVEYHERNYERALAQIQKLQRELVHEAEQKLLAEQKLETYKKELGLCS